VVYECGPHKYVFSIIWPHMYGSNWSQEAPRVEHQDVAAEPHVMRVQAIIIQDVNIGLYCIMMSWCEGHC
jgi:hypothetical protein